MRLWAADHFELAYSDSLLDEFIATINKDTFRQWLDADNPPLTVLPPAAFLSNPSLKHARRSLPHPCQRS
jgi:hypothetical protein